MRHLIPGTAAVFGSSLEAAGSQTSALHRQDGGGAYLLVHTDDQQKE